MKKLILLFLCVTAIHVSTQAGNDRPISFDQLPAQSQQMIKKYFPNQSVALVKMEREFSGKSYEVIFTNGNKAEFDRKGIWKEIDCKYTELPSEVVPLQIANYVRANYPDLKITKIEKKSRNRHEIELLNGMELEFDANFNVIDIDD
ncbi:PepSY-like domain-containing protein [Proteiniphilum saccharofermentans]|uniref:PepSY-like domain-containing protein n=1 Tax=Proteiniphilum saccharofermentans TaxID=1642647 RepID=UPI0028AA6C70|nr:PepSY-like domain-containing protein [Proteiniphilum saccharofermentans]